MTVREYHLPQRMIFDLIILYTDKSYPAMRVEFSPASAGGMLKITIRRQPENVWQQIYDYFWGKKLSFEITHGMMMRNPESIARIIRDVERYMNIYINPREEALK